MKEYFILSDIHSFYDEMIAALNRENFDINNPEHIIIVCGDLLDRGPKSKDVVSFFYDLYNKDRAILIRGNHEDLFDEIIKYGEYHSYDFSNGTMKTLGQLNTPEMSSSRVALLFEDAIYGYDRRWDFLRKNMINYKEIGNYIFVHGWIPVKDDNDIDSKNFMGVLYDPEWRNANREDWDNARWLNGMKYASEGILEPGKTIVCGHWHTSYGHTKRKIRETKNYSLSDFDEDADFSIFYDNGIIAIDACTAHSGFCNCLHLTEEQMYETKNNNS